MTIIQLIPATGWCLDFWSIARSEAETWRPSRAGYADIVAWGLTTNGEVLPLVAISAEDGNDRIAPASERLTVLNDIFKVTDYQYAIRFGSADEVYIEDRDADRGTVTYP